MSRNLTRTFGRCNYNGYEFNNTTRTTGITVTPVYDSAGRTIVYNVWRIELQTYIASESDTSPEVQFAVRSLQKAGGALYYQGRGAGNPYVNTSDVRDVKWGPTPGPIQITTYGLQNAVRLNWSVEIHLPECDQARYQFATLEFAYTATYETDDAGFTRRTFAGHLAVPITRSSQGDRLPPDSVDLYRGSIPSPPLYGFKRTYGPWVVSEDRTRLDWSYTDDEMGRAPPPYVVEVDADDSVSSTQAGLRSWTRTINATYRMKRGATGADAAVEFFNLIRYRLEFTRDELNKLPPNERAEIVPIGFSAAETIYGKNPTARFSMTFTYTSSIAYILGISGLWRPVYGSDWSKWANSVFDTSFQPYPGAQLFFDTSADAILDLCGPSAGTGGVPSPVPIVPPNRPPAGNQEAILVGQDMFKVLEQTLRSFPQPSPQGSWIDYRNSLYYETENGLIPTRPLPKEPLTNRDDILGRNNDYLGRAWDATAAGLELSTNVPGVVTPTVQPPGIPGSVLDNTTPDDTRNTGKSLRRVKPTSFVHMVGYGVRVAYGVEPPRLGSTGPEANAIEFVPANRLDFGEGVERGVSSNGAYPIHYTKWHLRYHLPSLPDGQTLPIPPNPLLGQA